MMKRWICGLVAVLLALFPAMAWAEAQEPTLTPAPAAQEPESGEGIIGPMQADATPAPTGPTDLEIFIELHNKAMDELRLKEYFGYSGYMIHPLLDIEKGEENDFIQFSIDGIVSHGFLQVNLQTDTENIEKVWIELPPSSSGNGAPGFLLEYCASILYGCGFTDHLNEVSVAMFDMGMYRPGAFAKEATGTALNKEGDRSVTYYCDEKGTLFMEVETVQKEEVLLESTGAEGTEGPEGTVDLQKTDAPQATKRAPAAP